MEQVQDNQPIAIAFPEDAIDAWAIVYVDVIEKLIDKETRSKSPPKYSSSTTEKGDSQISRSDIERRRSQAVAFNKRAEELRSEIKALERANKNIQSRRDQIKNQMRAW